MRRRWRRPRRQLRPPWRSASAPDLSKARSGHTSLLQPPERAERPTVAATAPPITLERGHLCAQLANAGVELRKLCPTPEATRPKPNARAEEISLPPWALQLAP